jgi:hypothetical protein
MRNFLLTLALVAGLAWASGYELPSAADSDWRTTLFLTPVGIAHNLSTQSALASFYGEKIRPRPITGSHAAVAGLYCALAALFFWQVRGSRRGRP